MSELVDKMRSVEEALISRGFLSRKRKGKRSKQDRKTKKSSKAKYKKRENNIEAQSENSSGS